MAVVSIFSCVFCLPYRRCFQEACAIIYWPPAICLDADRGVDVSVALALSLSPASLPLFPRGRGVVLFGSAGERVVGRWTRRMSLTSLSTECIVFCSCRYI